MNGRARASRTWAPREIRRLTGYVMMGKSTIEIARLLKRPAREVEAKLSMLPGSEHRGRSGLGSVDSILPGMSPATTPCAEGRSRTQS